MAYYALLDGLTLDRFKPIPVTIDQPIVDPLPELTPTEPAPVEPAPAPSGSGD
jgi:hypothetical protein